MAEMAISVTVFAILLIIALIIIFLIYPKLVSLAVNAIKEMISEIGKMICKQIPVIGWFC